MHFDQNLVLILVAAVIGIARLVNRIAQKTRDTDHHQSPKQQEQTTLDAPPSGRAATRRAKSDQDRVREFLEALGQPAGAAPPPKVQPRTDVPPRPLGPTPTPPLTRPFSPLIKPALEKAREILNPPQPTPTPLRPADTKERGAWLAQEARHKPRTAARARAKTAAGNLPEATEDAPAQNWRAALRSRESVRAAFVLREILGPPRAFAGYEAASDERPA